LEIRRYPRFNSPGGKLLSQFGIGQILFHINLYTAPWLNPWKIFRNLASIEPDQCLIGRESPGGLVWGSVESEEQKIRLGQAV